MTERQMLVLLLRGILVVAAVGLLLWFGWVVRQVLVLFLVSTILAVGISPVVDALAGDRPKRRFLPLSRGLIVAAFYVCLIGGLVIAALAVLPPVVHELEDLASKLPTYLEQIRQAARELSDAYPFLQGLDEQVAQLTKSAFPEIGELARQASAALRFASAAVNTVTSLFLVLVLTFYLILDGRSMIASFLTLLPEKHGGRAKTLLEQVRARIGAWLIGQMALSALVGLSTFIGLLLLGVPYALLLAVVAAFGELIPIIGPILSAIPAIIVAAVVSPMLGLMTAGLYIIVQQLENHIIVPQVMHRAIDLPPAVVILALLAGNELLGIIGAILALPVAAAIKAVVMELARSRNEDGPGDGD